VRHAVPLRQPLLPLVGQKLAAARPKEATAIMSACIVAAQLAMPPIALLVGREADVWGRKPLFLAGFAILPIGAADRRWPGRWSRAAAFSRLPGRGRRCP